MWLTACSAQRPLLLRAMAADQRNCAIRRWLVPPQPQRTAAGRGRGSSPQMLVATLHRGVLPEPSGADDAAPAARRFLLQLSGQLPWRCPNVRVRCGGGGACCITRWCKNVRRRCGGAGSCRNGRAHCSSRASCSVRAHCSGRASRGVRANCSCRASCCGRVRSCSKRWCDVKGLPRCASKVAAGGGDDRRQQPLRPTQGYPIARNEHDGYWLNYDVESGVIRLRRAAVHDPSDCLQVGGTQRLHEHVPSHVPSRVRPRAGRHGGGEGRLRQAAKTCTRGLTSRAASELPRSHGRRKDAPPPPQRCGNSSRHIR